ncbi:sensor histidine kinase [Labedella endophytica]|nr:histidine kinase [Labedella endophytica]
MASAHRTEDRTSSPRSRIVELLPPVLTLALAIGYVGLDLTDGFAEPVAGTIPPLVRGGLVAVQALALLARYRRPAAVFAVVVLLDLVILVTSAGELGTGAFAVMVAVYVLSRRVPRRRGYATIAIGAAATAIVSIAAGSVSPELTPLDGVFVALVRVIVQYAVPAAIGEYFLGRERLADALRTQAESVERERIERDQREVQAGRTALARELHDIAGHHLSGIIVSAQAASALTRSDPDRARETLLALQDDARTALADLRRTVGLLRHDDPSSDGTAAAPVAAPSIARVAALLDDARSRGVTVHDVLIGRPRPLGPLTETAAYRMVQESLANAVRHAPGATIDVRIEYSSDAVRLTVTNGPPADAAAAGRATATTADPGERERYGLAGMEERAGLVGGTLTTGPTADGGWSNSLLVPAPERGGTT